MIFTFKILMTLTFIAAVVVLFAGVFSMGKITSQPTKNKSNRLMMLRVALCFTLLVEMIIYAIFLR